MNESEFEQRVTETLLHIEQAVESGGVDIEFENVGGILTLEFANGSKIILNKQGVTKQLWVAAKSGGFHYGYRDGQWINDQSGQELMTELSRCIHEQSGEVINLS
jgi:CyaY protein